LRKLDTGPDSPKTLQASSRGDTFVLVAWLAEWPEGKVMACPKACRRLENVAMKTLGSSPRCQRGYRTDADIVRSVTVAY
jgi:hypothetical protein